MSRTARAHGRGNAPRLHARRGDVLQPFFYRRTSRRGDGRMTSSMGTGTGETVAVEAEAIILFSPREGFNADELAALEKDLGMIVTERLNAALKKGGAA